MLVQGWPWRQRERGRRSWPGLRSRPRGKPRHEHLRRRRAVAQRSMRAHHIVVPAPALDHDLGLLQAVEDFSIEKLISEPGIEALDLAVLPRAARGNVGRLRAHSRDPLLDGFGHELRAVIRADVARHAAQDEQVREYVDHINRLELASHPDRQALVRELVDHIQHPELATVMGPLLDKIIRPDVIAVLGPKADAGAVRLPDPAALGLPPGHFEPLAPPDALDPLLVHEPARLLQHGRDLAIAKAAVPTREFDDVGRELRFVVSAPRALALCRAVLTERPTGAALGDGQLPSDMLDAGASPRGAQKFPRAASCRMSLSSVRSAMARRSRAFSVSRSFSRLIWSLLSPPYSLRQR